MANADWVEDTDESPARTPAADAGASAASSDWVADPDWVADDSTSADQSGPSKPMGWGEYLGRGATGALPYLGAIGAGAAAAETGPGAVAAGTGGYMGGKEAERLLNHYLFGDEMPAQESPMDTLSRLYQNGKEGLEQEMLGMGTGKVLESLAPYLGKYAEKFAVRHLRPTPKVAQVLGPERLRDIGREALDSGAIKFGGKAEGTAARLSNNMDESGSLIDDLVNASDAKVNPVDIANRFENEVIAPLRKTSGNDALISKLEGQKQSFLEKYAPGHQVGGRDPSLPTTITRKSQFVPAEPLTPFEQGLKQIAEKRTPKVETEVVERQVPGPYQPTTETELRVHHMGDEVEPVMGYQTPEAGEPFQTDPRTGLPVKRVVEKRIEANPAPEPMTPAQIEAQKRVEDDRVNWLTDPKLNSKAQMGWAGVLRDEGEKAINDPAFLAAKRAYGNQALAKSMAERSAALTDGGTGLFGHMADLGVNLEALKMLAEGNPAGLAMSAARAGSKGRVASSLARTLDAASKVAGKRAAQQAGNLVSRPVWHRILQNQ